MPQQMPPTPHTHTWTHVDICCIAIPAITILAAPWMPILSLVDRSNLGQWFNEPIRCNWTNKENPSFWFFSSNIFFVTLWLLRRHVPCWCRGDLPLMMMLPPSPPLPPSGPPHSLRGSLWKLLAPFPPEPATSLTRRWSTKHRVWLPNQELWLV